MLEYTNFRFFDEYVYADIYENNNYVGVFGAEVCHLEYTTDLENEMFNKFRNAYLVKFGEHANKHLRLVK